MGAWGGYRNGEIPLSALSPIGNGQYAHAAAALRWFDLVAACKAATGITLTVTEGYRPLGIEADRRVLVESKTSTGGSNQWFQKGRQDRGLTPSAAWPGDSVHGWALAIDMGNYAAVWTWLKANAGKFGFAVDVIDDERWHIEFVGSLIVPASFNINLFGKDETMKYRVFTKKKVGKTPQRWLLVSPELLPNGQEETTDVFLKEVWENIAGMKAETISTTARFERLKIEATRLAALSTK